MALLNHDTAGDADGIWYLSHLVSELTAGHATSSEDHRAIAPQRYRIEVMVGASSLKLSAQCALRFRSQRDGVRMVRFELLPDLAVSSVSIDGRQIPFIQEGRHQDGSFYVQFPEALPKGSEHEVIFDYSGGEYMRDTGGRVLAIQPRRPWYPRIDAVSRALFDITFRVPRGMTAVSIGKLLRQETQGSQDVFQWTSDAPLPPVGFNYGDYRLKQRPDEKSGYLIESYLSNSGKGNASPSSDLTLTNAGSSVELFQRWFGPLPYGRLGVVESSTSDSLPGLIFLPAITLGAIPVQAYRFGMVARIGRILDEALPAVASRQWWGGLVVPASFHDAWITRGLADFSTALYDEAAGDTEGVRQHWSRSHDALMTQDAYGLKIREAPPVWFGSMTDIHSTLGASVGPGGRGGAPASLYTLVSNALLVRKGGFIIHMLRQLMRDPKTGDRDFIAMMHDFTAICGNHSASTEDFRAVIEKHMKPVMVMDREGGMRWFFDDWVYGTSIPSYHLDYTLTKADGGRFKLAGLLTQRGVSESFAMRVRVYVRIGKRTLPAMFVPVQGNHSAKFEVTLPEEPKDVLLNAEYDVLAEHQDVKRVQTLAVQ